MKTPDLKNHPCFNPEVKGQYGRVHLPVAPGCNIKCNYCNRKYDCVNESRPGVTSGVLTPEQALIYVEKVLEKEPRITVAGIAGPGDPFAESADATMETMRLIRKSFPEMILCLSSNGLGISPYIDEIAEIQVSHVTITVNTVDPEIGKKVYSWVKEGKIVYQGKAAAELLLKRQLSAIKKLKAKGITVKVNCIMIPGINDRHIVDVAAKMKELGVDLFNCMALFPTVGTVFADLAQPTKLELSEVQKKAEYYLPQMRHCTRCRADAVGLLGNDRIDEFRSCLTSCSTIKTPLKKEDRKYVGVATMEGVLVNQHLGEAESIQIWKQTGDDYELMEERSTPESGGGIRRWTALSRILEDCKAILVSNVGDTPKQIIEESGVKVFEMNGFIEKGLEAVFKGKPISTYKSRKVSSCSSGGCKGTGLGCG